MGDGAITHLTRSEIRAEVEAGTAIGAKRAKVPPLEPDEIDHVVDIYASPARFTGVDLGDEIILSCDGTGMKTHATRQQDMQSFEQWLGADLVKVVRTILPYEAQCLHDAQLQMVVPMQYGVMPNLGLYSKPDGPCDNWNELLPLNRVDDARLSQEEAVEMAVQDMVKLADAMWEAGADGLDWDTTGASGDPEFLAALRATEIVRKKYPDMGVELGMAGEFVLGMNGQMEYDGVRLAGLYPHDQMLLAQKAGATMFGPVVNINTGKSCAWNMARALTLIKPCMADATVPIHPNAGMGVGGVPMFVHPIVDAVCRAAKCFVDILKIDGL
jgi:dimethylamine--corrinoid protein Co-methyltransferase